MKQIKEEWSTEKREKFENRLVSLGWEQKCAGYVPCLFKKGNLTIETDGWGIWIYEDGQRLFGLSDNYVDDMVIAHVGPLIQNPFADKKRYLWLNLATGGYTTKKGVRKTNEQPR